ncbi:MAG: DUF4013 domain-containing protein [Anaerolineales bacterium]|nr:DUF4013 domain-containing protein [Anaerolineales bacterium]
MDISRALTFTFEDKDWVSKLGVGALVSLVPVLNFAWLGYTVQLVRNVEAGQTLALPSWEDLDKKLMDGLKLGVAMLIYGLPLFAMLFIPMALFILPALTDNEDWQAVLATVGGAGFLGMLCLMLLYGLALGFVYPAIELHYAHTGTFAACFQWGRIIALIREHSSNYLAAWALSLVVGLAFGFVVSAFSGLVGWIPCIGFVLVLLALPLSLAGGLWVAAVHAHLLGQVAAPRPMGVEPPV